MGKKPTPDNENSARDAEQLDFEQIRLGICREINAMAVEDFKNKFSALYGRIMALATAVRANVDDLPVLKKEGRIATLEIPAADPFIDGVLRTYLKVAGSKARINASARPIRLDSDDPAAVVALKSYWLRANGAGDVRRMKISKEAMAAF